MRTIVSLIREKRSGRADCLARKHSSKLTVGVKLRDDGTWLVKCHVGCATIDVLRSEGLSFCDLFPDRNETPAMRASRKLAQVAAEDQEARRNLRISAVCTMLRNVDSLILDASDTLRFAQQHGIDSTARDILEFALSVQRELEAELNRLDPRFQEVHG